MTAPVTVKFSAPLANFLTQGPAERRESANRNFLEYPAVLASVDAALVWVDGQANTIFGQTAAATTAATAASASAGQAAVSAAAAAATSTAANWVSGTTYAVGNVRRSLIDGLPYQRLTAGAGTTDPRNDPTNWALDVLQYDTLQPTLRPSLLLDFANSLQVDGRVGNTRTSSAHRRNAQGLLEPVGPGVSRVQFDAQGNCLGLLSECAATNLLTHSNNYADAVWGKVALGTGTAPIVTPNYGTGPDGVAGSSTRIQADRGAGNGLGDYSLISRSVIGMTNASVYSSAIWVKGVVGEQIAGVFLDGTLIHTFSGLWERIGLTRTASSATGFVNFGSRGGVSANNAIDFEVWNAQVELGAAPTSEIITGASTATRARDNASMPISTSQSEFSVLAEVTQFALTVNLRYAFILSNALAGHSVYAYLMADNSLVIRVMVANTVVASLAFSAAITGSRFKVAVSVKENAVQAAVNGVLSAIDTSAAFPSGLNTLRVGRPDADLVELNGTVANVALYQRAMSPTELQMMTRY